ncbi:MAG: IPT/TIG domain-containing protein [Candidatus Colwellbacteria bacterium]|nr:IPT/TIG domain-containing protein [Candidatus Colwellbacteria bacterium]
MRRLITDIYRPPEVFSKRYFFRGVIILVIGLSLIFGNWLGLLQFPGGIQKAEAAVTVTGLTSAYDGVNRTSYSTASITPSANKLILVSLVTRGGTVNPTVSGNGLTWDTVKIEGEGLNMALWVFRSMGASPSTGSITFNFGAETQSAAAWSVDEFSNMDTGGTNGSGAIVQSVGNTVTGTSITVTLAAFSDVNNATFGAVVHNRNEAHTQGDGFTKVSDVSGASPDQALMAEFKGTNDTSVDASWVTSGSARGIGIEIKAAVPAPTVTSVTGQNPQSTAGGFSITINGTDFVATPSVTVGGTSATGVTFVSSTELTATAPAKAAGSYDVVVTNPDSQAGTCTTCMTYIAPPTVTDVSPNSDLNTAGGETVTITGTGIKVGSNGVKVDTTNATTSGTSTSATFTTPAHAAGSVTLRVYGDQGTDSNGIYYDYSPFTYGSGGEAASGNLISSTFDTGFSGGVKINSVLWQGTLGTGGTNNVKFQVASANCSNGATNAPTCTTSTGWGGSKTSGDGAFIGSDGTSSTYYGPVSPNTPSVTPTNHHNNKRYFRYKVFLDKDAESTTPVVQNVILNYSP